MLRRLAGLFAVMALALILPASASAGGAHLLRLYKVEKHVDLEGDAQYNLKCLNGDYAVDGMWRVDHVDQDNDLPGNIKEYVAVYAAYPDSSDKSEYHFKIENLAGGDSQIKLFLTCLGKTTEPDGYVNSFNLSSRKVDSHSGGPGLAFGWMPPNQECGNGEIAVAPGFEFFNGSGRLVGSRTSLAGDGPPVGRNWSQVFMLDSNSNWKTYMRCLQLKSNPGPGGKPAHKILVTRVGGPTSYMKMIPAGWEKEIQATCGEHYKGMVHGFDTTPGYAQFLYFWGMDPRIKARAYLFFNHDYNNPIGVWTGLTCFKDKTN
jgi:hypothetical protein